MDDFWPWIAAAYLEAGQSIEDVAIFFDAYHSVMYRLWKQLGKTSKRTI